MVATSTSALKLQLLQEIFDAEQTLLICVDAAERVTAIEGRKMAAWGRSEADMLGLPLTKLFAANEEAMSRWRRCLAGERVRGEGTYGSTYWLQLYYPLRDPDGAIVGAAMVAFDVTRDLQTARQATLLRELVNNVPTNVYALDPDGVCQISEGGLLYRAGLKPGEGVGVNLLEVYGPAVPGLSEGVQAAFRGESTVIEFPIGDRLYSQAILPRRDSSGGNAGAYCIAADITEQRRNEDLMREHMRVIQDQKEAITRLSSPIIEVGHDVLAIPLVGVVDGERAAVIMHGLLEAIVHKRARFAILDLTGVETVDPSSAEHLIRIVHSVRLLGATAIITGIRPAIARTMTELGLDLAGLLTLRTLQDALLHCGDASPRPR